LKTERFIFRVSEQDSIRVQELTEFLIEAGATDNGKALKRSSVLRRVIEWITNKKPLVDDEEFKTEIAAEYRGLNNLGNNLNQLAKAYNEGLITRPIDMSEPFNELHSKIDNLTNAFRAYLQVHNDQRQTSIAELIEILGDHQ